MDASLLIVQPASAEPIYRQIVAQLRRLIVGGQLAAGDALPSVGEVAGFHAINTMTVSRAYGLAKAEGLLERQRGKGMVVASTRKSSQTESRRLALLEPQMIDLARQARELELPAEPVLRRVTKLLGGSDMNAVRQEREVAAIAPLAVRGLAGSVTKAATC